MKCFIGRCSLCLYLLIFSCCSNGLPDLGNGYHFAHNSANDLSIVKPEHTYILYGAICEIAIDSTFILAAEKPRDSVPCSGDLKHCDDLFANSDFRQYWIINKMNDSVHGPFDDKAFQVEREEMKVPKTLTLEPLPKSKLDLLGFTFLREN